MADRESDGDGRRELQARLLWFRSDHPDAEIETELVVAEEDMAVCRATLRTQAAGAASAHGSALRDERGSAYVEIAENRAMSRALTALGYGAAPVETEEDESAVAQVPPIDLVSARSLLREEPEPEDEEEPEQRPQPIRRAQAEQAENDTDNGANVSWNKFWAWARPRGYTTARELNEILGVDNVLAYTPGEVRRMLVKYEMDNPPGGSDE